MTTLNEGLAEYQRKIESGEIERPAARDPVQRYEDKNTRATAIAAFCCACMGYPGEGYRASIRDCTSKDCSLYSWRPYK